MTGEVYNITTDQGSTFTLQFSIATDGTAWNLDGYSGRMQVRSSVSSSTKLLDLVSPTNISLTSLGMVTITVSAASMAAVPAGQFVYDFELVSPTGNVQKIIKGAFVVLAEVTR